MNIETLGTNLGITGLVVLVGYKLAMVLIRNWRETERERTKALSDGFAQLVGKVDNHASTDIQSHERLATGIAEIKGHLGIRETGPVLRVLRHPTQGDE